MLLFDNVSTVLISVAFGTTRSCVVVSTPSLRVCDDGLDGGIPCGLLKGVSDGVRRLSESLSESSEKEDKSTVEVNVVSVTFGEGTGRERGVRSSNMVCTF